MTRRLASAIAVVVALLGAPLRAQVPGTGQFPGMPDMSKAPADVQAIWKRMAAGGQPTADEVKRLAEWITNNRNQIVKDGQQSVAAAKQFAGSQQGSGFATSLASGSSFASGGADLPSCPAKSMVSPSLAAPPSAAGAAALLDTVRSTYVAMLSAKGQSKFRAIVTSANDAAELNQIAGLFYLHGDGAPAMLVYVAAAERATGSVAARAWADLGAALVGLGQRERAIRALRRAQALGAHNATVLTNLGVAYADLGDFSTGMSLLGQATQLSPKSGTTFESMSRTASCAGNMVAAWHALEQAQDEDFGGNRQDLLDKHAQDEADQSPNANPDAADAEKPLPEPPGPPLFPAPGGGAPADFNAYQPKVGQSFSEHRNYLVYNVQMSNNFRQLGQQILAEPGVHTVSHVPGGTNAVYTVALSNGRDATRAIDVVERRAHAKAMMMLVAFNDKNQQINSALVERLKGVSTCEAAEAISNAAFADAHGAYNVYLGGVSGLAEQFNSAMNRWFDWAADPETRSVIDQRRRYILATFQIDVFNAAANLGRVGTACGKPTETAASQPKKGDKRDEGKCESRSIHIWKFADMDADCHQMTMTITFPPISDLMGGDPTMALRRATPDKYGKFFIGITGEVGGDVPGSASVDWSAGAQVTWDQNGWVKGSGPAGSLTSSTALGSMSGDVMLNTRQSGPVFQGSGSASTLGMTQSTAFGGRY